MAHLGRAVRLARTAREMKRREMSQRTALSYAYLSQIERGARTPSSRALQAIADALEMPVSELVAMADHVADSSPVESLRSIPPPSGDRSRWFDAPDPDGTRSPFAEGPPLPVSPAAAAAPEPMAMPSAAPASVPPPAMAPAQRARFALRRSGPPEPKVAATSSQDLAQERQPWEDSDERIAPPAAAFMASAPGPQATLDELLEVAASLDPDDLARLIDLARRLHG